MERKGFSHRWIKWIAGCIGFVNYSVMINGRPRGNFAASRGLRQGDPLSPYLFTLIVNPLSKLLDRAVDASLFTPLSVGRSNIKGSQHQYVDDTLFFSSNEEESLMNLTSILEIFLLSLGIENKYGQKHYFGLNLEEG